MLFYLICVIRFDCYVIIIIILGIFFYLFFGEVGTVEKEL